MHSKRHRRAVALLVVLGLLVVAAPAAAAPEAAAGEPAFGSFFFKALGAWLAGLLPAQPAAAVPSQAWAATCAWTSEGPRPPGEVRAANDPTADPELGGDIDPDG